MVLQNVRGHWCLPAALPWPKRELPCLTSASLLLRARSAMDHSRRSRSSRGRATARSRTRAARSCSSSSNRTRCSDQGATSPRGVSRQQWASWAAVSNGLRGGPLGDLPGLAPLHPQLPLVPASWLSACPPGAAFSPPGAPVPGAGSLGAFSASGPPCAAPPLASRWPLPGPARGSAAARSPAVEPAGRCASPAPLVAPPCVPSPFSSGLPGRAAAPVPLAPLAAPVPAAPGLCGPAPPSPGLPAAGLPVAPGPPVGSGPGACAPPAWPPAPAPAGRAPPVSSARPASPLLLPPPGSPPVLPAGWVCRIDNMCRPYYVDYIHGVSQWLPPSAAAAPNLPLPHDVSQWLPQSAAAAPYLPLPRAPHPADCAAATRPVSGAFGAPVAPALPQPLPCVSSGPTPLMYDGHEVGGGHINLALAVLRQQTQLDDALNLWRTRTAVLNFPRTWLLFECGSICLQVVGGGAVPVSKHPSQPYGDACPQMHVEPHALFQLHTGA